MTEVCVFTTSGSLRVFGRGRELKIKHRIPFQTRNRKYFIKSVGSTQVKVLNVRYV